MNFANIWNTSQEDYYILFFKRILSDSSYFLSNMASKFDNFFLGHTVYSLRYYQNIQCMRTKPATTTTTTTTNFGVMYGWSVVFCLKIKYDLLPYGKWLWKYRFLQVRVERSQRKG